MEVYEKNLEELDENERKEYEELLMGLNTNSIARRIIEENYGKSIEKISQLIEYEIVTKKSSDWFNTDNVLVYPSIKEVKAKKQYDTIYGAHIGINMTYIDYHALIINTTKKTKYVLEKSLKFELNDTLPMNIHDLEKLESDTETTISLRRVDKVMKLVK